MGRLKDNVKFGEFLYVLKLKDGFFCNKKEINFWVYYRNFDYGL